MSGHTPGPWQAMGAAESAGREADDWFVADSENDAWICVGPSWDAEHMDESFANARLIAAAPELLEALQTLDALWAESESNGVDFSTAIDAARAAMSEWQPIETAPKDGSEILIFVPPATYTQGYIRSVQWRSAHIDFWHVEDNKFGPFPLRGGAPTHWMPLPEPPK